MHGGTAVSFQKGSFPSFARVCLFVGHARAPFHFPSDSPCVREISRPWHAVGFSRSPRASSSCLPPCPERTSSAGTAMVSARPTASPARAASTCQACATELQIASAACRTTMQAATCDVVGVRSLHHRPARMANTSLDSAAARRTGNAACRTTTGCALRSEVRASPTPGPA
jgi:hypothetical protein